jgi:glycosyltransferase involved in cell wall biosynthesis
MQIRAPRLTVGMPVYNADRTLATALEALLGQTFGDFELVVSDNASTDGTPDLLARYAALDPRLRVVRQPQNRGANPNYSEVARRARGEYFKWASSNDWCAPTFLQRCIDILDARSDIVLAFPRTKLFTARLEDAEEYPYDFGLESDSPAERFVQLASELRLNNVMNGVIRVAALRRTRLVPHHCGSDIVLMAHLALLGKFAQVPEPLFFRRMEPQSATRLMSADAVRRHHYPRPDARSLFQSWRLSADWFRVVLAAPIPIAEKRRAFAHTARTCYQHWRDLVQDFREAVHYVGRGITP